MSGEQRLKSSKDHVLPIREEQAGFGIVVLCPQYTRVVLCCIQTKDVSQLLQKRFSCKRQMRSGSKKQNKTINSQSCDLVFSVFLRG